MNVGQSQPGSAGLGLAGLLPATVAAPAACGPSLLAGQGAGAAGLLGAVAPPLLALSALLLVAQLWLLRRASEGQRQAQTRRA